MFHLCAIQSQCPTLQASEFSQHAANNKTPTRNVSDKQKMPIFFEQASNFSLMRGKQHHHWLIGGKSPHIKSSREHADYQAHSLQIPLLSMRGRLKRKQKIGGQKIVYLKGTAEILLQTLKQSGCCSRICHQKSRLNKHQIGQPVAAVNRPKRAHCAQKAGARAGCTWRPSLLEL